MISNSRALAGLRIAVGALFLIFAQYKVFGREFTSGGGFQHWINRFIEDGAYPFMVPVLRNFVLPHAKSIAFLVAYGELMIGLALVLGILVRPASVCGLIYMLTLLFASNYPGPQRGFLAILRRFARSSGAGVLLRYVCGWSFRRGFVGTGISAAGWR
jgi:uncharacterized membrane protein YphA (DoxX/SURF4 family)